MENINKNSLPFWHFFVYLYTLNFRIANLFVLHNKYKPLE